MRRIPIPYVLAAVLAVGLAGGLYAIASSGSGPSAAATSTPATQPPRAVTTATDPAAPARGALARTGIRGVTLLSRVRRTYSPFGAVVITGQSGALSARFTVLLAADRVVAEGFVGTRAGATTMLVAPHGSPTFALDPRSSCWRLVAASDPQALTDIGQHFPFLPKGVFLEAPRRTPLGWSLRARFDGTSSTYAIDGTTLLVRSITVKLGGKSVIEQVRTLTTAPQLPSPKPRC